MISIEDFFIFYEIGIVVSFFICIYEYKYEQEKIKRIHEKFNDIQLSDKGKIILNIIVWTVATLLSWIYVGTKITNILNKKDVSL